MSPFRTVVTRPAAIPRDHGAENALIASVSPPHRKLHGPERYKKGMSGKYGMRGFTLVETLAVLAVFSILACIFAATLSRLVPAANLNHASRALVSLCRHARLEAIRTNGRTRLDCDSAANACSLTDRGNNRALSTLNFSELQHGISITRSFTTDFTSTGRATRAGTLTVRNAAGTTRSVVIRVSGGVVTR